VHVDLVAGEEEQQAQAEVGEEGDELVARPYCEAIPDDPKKE
jgi:hypothetical protein